MVYESVKRNKSSKYPAHQPPKENQFSPRQFHPQAQPENNSREGVDTSSTNLLSRILDNVQTKSIPEVEESSRLESEEQEHKLEQDAQALSGEGEPEKPNDENSHLSSQGVIQRLCSECEGEKDAELKVIVQS